MDEGGSEVLDIKGIEKDILNGPYPDNIKDQVTALAKRIEELEEEREKLKPFVKYFNDFHGTNLTLGADTVETTFEKYHVISNDALQPMVKLMEHIVKANEKTEEENFMDELDKKITEIQIPWLKYLDKE